LRTQESRERSGERDPRAAGDAIARRPEDQIDLMRRTPDTQNWVLAACDRPSDETAVESSHRVLAVRRHADQIGAPFSVQRIEELDKHVEDVQRRVAIKHGNGHEVQIEKPALQADAHAQVEERLATESASISRQRKGPDYVVVEHLGNHLQIGGDKDADVLSDDQIIDAQASPNMECSIYFHI
jgi:hypothetical protein